MCLGANPAPQGRTAKRVRELVKCVVRDNIKIDLEWKSARDVQLVHSVICSDLPRSLIVRNVLLVPTHMGEVLDFVSPVPLVHIKTASDRRAVSVVLLGHLVAGLGSVLARTVNCVRRERVAILEALFALHAALERMVIRWDYRVVIIAQLERSMTSQVQRNSPIANLVRREPEAHKVQGPADHATLDLINHFQALQRAETVPAGRSVPLVERRLVRSAHRVLPDPTLKEKDFLIAPGVDPVVTRMWSVRKRASAARAARSVRSMERPRLVCASAALQGLRATLGRAAVSGRTRFT